MGPAGRQARRRRGRWTRAITLLSVITVAGCSSTVLPSGSGTTSTGTGSSTTAVGCPAFGSAGASSGRPAVEPSGVVLLRNIQVQASACVDEVSFLFWKGTPTWTAGYQEGSLSLDPSGQPATVPGAAHLVLRLRRASGVDVSVNPPHPSYDGPTEMAPGAPSGVVGIRRLGDFEAVATWAVGLADRRPFEVVTRRNQLVLRMASPTPRVTRCTTPGSPVSIGYPSGWFAELSPRWSCRYFDPGPFVAYPATDAMDWAVTAEAADAPAATVVSRLVSPGGTVQPHRARVAGLEAMVMDVTTTGQGLYPPGYGYRIYVLPTSPTAFVISSRPSPSGPEAGRSRSAADRIASLVRTG